MLIILVWIACIVAGVVIGGARDSKRSGMWLGILLGPLGVLLACVIPLKKDSDWA